MTAARLADGSTSIAVVGLACRYPDADDPPALLDLIATGRRAFRRIPPCRVDLADYYSSGFQAPDATYSTRAALIEGWQFDREAFGVSDTAYDAADPAHWLALETAGRALAAAGFPGGAGLPADSCGVIIGNSLAGDVSRASALRLRWPYSRRVLADALFAAGLPADLADRVLRTAAERYLAPFPPVGNQTLVGSMPAGLAAFVGRHLGFRGGGFTVDGGGASSLVAIATACLALTSGELDVAVAGGVDISLDPLELVGMAKSRVLATGDMRVYDENPTGFLPGEGCGVLLLMRTCDARAAELPVYAEILGWGIASAGHPGAPGTGRGQLWPDAGLGWVSDADSQLLALRSAYRRAGIDPADVQLIEGSGIGTAAGDEAELTALTTLLAGARQRAALGSIAANIGNTRAAAGAASLIKAVLAITNGVLPPATGCRTPHPMLREAGPALRLPRSPECWPEGIRLAGVSAMGPGGLNAHLVLRGQPGMHTALGRLPRIVPRSGRAEIASAATPVSARPAGRRRPIGAARPAAYLLHAPDRAALAAVLARVADLAPWLSDAEMSDLACQFARDAASQSQARVAIVATRQEQLARLASEAITLLPRLTGGLLTVRPGIFAADGADGRVTLLLSDRARGRLGASADTQLNGDSAEPELSGILAALHWLDTLGVQATAAVGHGAGALAGLVWAGCTTAASAQRLYAARADALALPPAAAAALLARAIEELAVEFRPPSRRLISGCTGAELAGAEAITGLLAAEVAAPGRLSQALTAGAVGASLLLETGPGRTLVTVAGRVCNVPAVSLDGGPDDERHAARAAAALFAAGALSQPGQLYAGRPGRPADIWREQIFIANPCQMIPRPAGADQNATRPASGQAASGQAASSNPAATSTGGPQAGVPQAGVPQTGVPQAGVAPWSKCYAEQLWAPAGPVPAGDDRPWRLYLGGCEPLRRCATEFFRHDQAASRTLAVLGDLDDPLTIETALEAARDAVSSGQLVVIGRGRALTGLWASLHAEHPALGLTVLRPPLTADGIRAAGQIAVAVPAAFRELVIDADGGVREPVMVPVPLTGGADFPLGPDDVVLVSRGAGAAGLVLAQVLACSGAAVAVIGRDHPEHDEGVIAALEQLRLAGARVTYEVVDTSHSGGMAAAVRRIEQRLGPVTAIGHAAGPAPRQPVAQIGAADLRRHLADQTAVLDHLVGAVLAGPASTGQLRLIATFGSVAAHYGVAAEGPMALATAALATRGELLAASNVGCRALHADWPAWSGAGLGERPGLAASMERAGFAPMPVSEGSRLLLKALATGGLPDRIALHGRVGIPAPHAIAATVTAGQRPTGRFAEQVLVHYPGVELILQARLCMQADPYLADYRIDGMPVLPPTMALEALAQAASALAGEPVRTATEVTMAAPVLLPAGVPGSSTLIRICALREAGAVTAVLRCESSGFGVDHYRAVFGCQSAVTEQAAAGSAAAGIASQAQPRRARPAAAAAAVAAAVDGSELYGPICFQAGRFRRLATIRAVTAHSATAVARGPDEMPWFGAGRPLAELAGQGLLLGSPGLGDAALQVVQACVPHRRLVPAGCESVAFSGATAEETVLIRATEVTAQLAAAQVAAAAQGASQPPPSAVAVPRQRTADRMTVQAATASDTVWDVEAFDPAGRPLFTWRRLRMRDTGPLPPAVPWPVPLLAGYLERVCATLGLSPSLEIQIWRRDPAASSPPGIAAVPSQPRSPRRQRMTGGWVPAPPCDPGLARLGFRVRAAGPAACGWQLVRQTPDPGSARPPIRTAGGGSASGSAPAVHRGRGPALADAGETAATAAARRAAITACLSAGSGPADLLVGDPRSAGDGWLVLNAGGASIACVVLELAGLRSPVAIALMTGPGLDTRPTAGRTGRKRAKEQAVTSP